jgi:hypothetical protein
MNQNFPLVDLHGSLRLISLFDQPQRALGYRLGEIGITAEDEVMEFRRVSRRSHSECVPQATQQLDGSVSGPESSLVGLFESLGRDPIGD